MIIVDLIVAFAFFVFISIFYKRGSIILDEYLTKYSYNLEQGFKHKKQLYEKKQHELNDLKNDIQAQKEIDKIVQERKKRVNEIISTYQNIEKKYSHHIDDKITCIKNYLLSDRSSTYQVQKKYVNSHLKFDINQLLVKFANLHKKRHNID